MIKVIENKIYYKCTNNSNKHISTGNPEWDDNLFCSTDLELAKAYGSNIEIIKAKPEARIIREGDPKLKVRMRSNEKYMDYLLRNLRSAKELGYDIIEFKRQGDVGTIIINKNSIIRNYKI